MVFFAPTFAPTNLEVIKVLWHFRPHLRSVAPNRVFPSRLRATRCFDVLWIASRVRARLDHLR